MAIADELTKLEANRANIVAAINSKGGELAENAGLSACPEAISQLVSAGGTTLWTGHVDEAGLRYIGWDDEVKSCTNYSKTGSVAVNPECQVEIPKTGDVSVVAYAVMALVAAAGAMGLKK